jgi:SAM-dependent methyltransferase
VKEADMTATAIWGARARDWATIEDQQVPTYEAALSRLSLGPGDAVLDVGCGTGVFLRAAAERGATAAGLDAAEELLEIARERVPRADLRTGDMESLPWDDASFDAVTGFNSFFFASDMVAALREAGRVAKPGAPVVIQVWGAPERCSLVVMKDALGRFLPAQGQVQAPPLYEPGVLEGIAGEAGLHPAEAFDSSWSYRFVDDDDLARALLSPQLAVRAIAAAGEEPVRAALLEAMAPYRSADGSYTLPNDWHYLIARA